MTERSGNVLPKPRNRSCRIRFENLLSKNRIFLAKDIADGFLWLLNTL